MVTSKVPHRETAAPPRAMPLIAWALPLILPLFLALLFTLVMVPTVNSHQFRVPTANSHPTLAPTANSHPTLAPVTQTRAALTEEPKPPASQNADRPVKPSPTAPVSEGAGPLTLPAFTLPGLDGKPVSTKEWQGKVVLVDFWATWCAGCRQTIPALARLQEKYGPRGLVVAGISLDKGASSKVAKFTRKLKVNYTVLVDAEDSLSKVFGFEGLPSLYLFDRQGKLVKSMPGYSEAQDKELEALVSGLFPAP